MADEETKEPGQEAEPAPDTGESKEPGTEPAQSADEETKEPEGSASTSFSTAAELEAAGFELTPEIWHTGSGDGHVYEKIVDGNRASVKVDAEGKVVAE